MKPPPPYDPLWVGLIFTIDKVDYLLWCNSSIKRDGVCWNQSSDTPHQLIKMTYKSRLPNNHTLLRCHPHGITLLDIKGLVESRDILECLINS